MLANVLIESFMLKLGNQERNRQVKSQVKNLTAMVC
jgi:hypothetical protein